MADSNSNPRRTQAGPLRLIIFAAVGMLLGFGLCGAFPSIAPEGREDIAREGLGAIVILGSGITGIVGIVRLIQRSGGSKPS